MQQSATHAGGAPSAATHLPPTAHQALPSDRLVFIALFLLTIATRLPFRTHLLFNWDAANFAFALDAFDVTQHRPHPPGYPLFVLTGWLVRLVVQDANLALVLISMALSAAAVAATYWAGSRLFSRSVGLAAALLLLTSVTFWTYGAVALAYPALALASALALDLTAPPLRRSAPLLMSLMLGIAGAFRPDLLLWLGPLWAWTLLRSGWRGAVPAAALAGILVLGWLVPTVLLSGGLDAYVAVMRAYIGIDVVERYAVVRQGASGLITNLRDTASYLVYALYAALPLLAWAIAKGFRQRLALLRDPRLPAFALLLAPPTLFLPLIHVGDPGYVFTLLPPLLLLAAAGMLSSSSRVAWAVLGLILAANAAIFLVRERPLTAWGLRQHDRVLADTIKAVRSCCPPESTVMLTYESFKLARYYLPDYPRLFYSDITSSQPQGLDVPSSATRLLLLDESLFPRARGLTLEMRLLDAGPRLAEARTEGRRRLVYGSAIYLEP